MDWSSPKEEFSSQQKSALMRQESRPRRPFPTRRQSLSKTPAHDQSQSPLFKLPAELRRAIYSEAGLANATIHCFTREFENQTGAATCPVERLTKKTSTNIYHGKVCTHPQDGSSAVPYGGDDAPKHCGGCATASHQALTCLPASFIDFELQQGTSPSCIVPLLQTCRRLYTEALPILYAETTFSFTDLFSLADFVTCAVPAAHAARIRSLALTWSLLMQPFVARSSLSSGMRRELRRRHDPRGRPVLLLPPYAAPPPHLVGPPHDAATWRDKVWGGRGVVRALLPGLRRLRLELADRLDDACGVQRLHEVWSGKTPPSYARPEELWLEWLRPVGAALEGREVVVEGGIWCRFDGEGEGLRRHAVIKGGGGGEKRVLVLADGGEEVEW